MEYKLFEEFITLQALLKELGIIHSGGAIKYFLPSLEEQEEYLQEKLEKERVAKFVKEMNKTVKKKPTKKTPKAKTKTAPRFPGR